MSDGPTFFGPEGVTKGNATPPPAPQAPKPAPPPKPAPEPERKTFTEVETVATPRRMSSESKIALIALGVVATVALGIYLRPEPKAYQMGTYAPLGPLEVRAMEFDPGVPNSKGVARAWVLARFTIKGTEGVDLQKISATLLDSEGRTYHAEPRASTDPEILNPGLDKGSTWTFVRPEQAAITQAQFTFAGGDSVRIAVKPYREPVKLTDDEKPRPPGELERILNAPTVVPEPVSDKPDQMISEFKRDLPNIGGKFINDNCLKLETESTKETWWFGPYVAPKNIPVHSEDDPRRVVAVEIHLGETGGDLNESDLKRARELWQRSFQGHLCGADLEAGHQALHSGFHSRPKKRARFVSDCAEATWPGDNYEVQVRLYKSNLYMKVCTKEPGIPAMEPLP